MKKISRSFRFLLLVVSVFSTTTPSFSQWVQTNGPCGGTVRCFAVSGTSLFAGNDYSGVYRSTNNGTSWTAVNTGLTNTEVFALAPDSSGNLFAGTWGGGVFFSTNGGTTWTAASTGLNLNNDIEFLGVSGTNVFAGAYPGGVFLSTNNGTSWTAANAGLTNTDIQSLAASGANLFAGIHGGGVFLSTNNGTTWAAANTGLTNTYVDALALSGTNLFAGTSGGGVFLSTNNGTSWTAVNNGLTNTTVPALAASGTNLFAGTDNAGVFLSTDSGTSWTAVNTGLTSTDVAALAFSGTNLFAGTDYLGAFLSTDNGTNWTAVDSGLTKLHILAFAVSGTTLFAGTAAGGIFLSTNNGTSWVYSGFKNHDGYAFAVSGTDIFAGAYNGVFLSTNNGTSWTAANAGLPGAQVHALAAGGTNVYAGTYGKGVFLSTNKGTSWTAVNTGLTNNLIYSLAISGANLFAGTEDGGVFLSTDNGTTWAAANTGLTNHVVNSLLASGTSLLAGTASGVFVSTDDGTSWVFGGLKNYHVNAFAVSGKDIFAGTVGGSVWRLPLFEIVTPPPNLTAIPGNGQILLHWNNYNYPGFMRFRIYGDTLPHPITLIDSTPGGVTDTTKVVTGLANGTAYYFRVTAVDSASIESGYSSEVVAIPDVFIYSMNIRWNMVSVPLTVADYSKSALFPFAISPAYAYEGGYVVKDTFVNGYAYWIKLNGSQYASMNGTLRTQDTISVQEGWNMVGSISTPIAASQITSDPGGLVTSQFYGYVHGYHVSDTIQPGKGYWAKLNQSGKLVLASSSAAARASKRIRIVPTQELPPAAPDGKEVADAIPTTYALELNYPNPFNPTTEIRYQMPEARWVTLKVYDVLGREVATLVNEVKQPGEYTVTWNASSVADGIPSGVYFYRITAGTFTETKKLLLLR